LRGVCGDQLFLREQPANTYVLKKADRLVRSAGSVVPAN
jgi:hypothetical protein